MIIEIPKICPNCSFNLVRIKDQLFCKNDSCSAIASKKISHFSKTMKIKGLGEKTIQKMNINEISDIYNISRDFYVDILGQKIGEKIYKEINNSKNVDFITFLSAFSITLIGKTAATKLSLIIENIENITKDICIKAGLGEKSTQSLIDWIEKKYITNYINLPINICKINNISNKIIVCISGKLDNFKTKTDAENYLNSKGISVVSSMSKNVDFLISEDWKNSNKVKKANSYSIPIVSIIELIEEK